jgi:hypothetical protein
VRDVPNQDEIWGGGWTMDADAIVVEVASFEELPVGSSGSRRAIVWWSDGSLGEALRWWDDEVLLCEGDLIGKTRAELRALKGRRDLDFLKS